MRVSRNWNLALVAGLAHCLAQSCSPRAPHDWVAIPHPLNVSVDDCGWQSGLSLSALGGPYRLGSRDPTLEDYQRLSRIAQKSGTRLPTFWVMSELDRSNICGRPEYNLPLAPSDMTEYGLLWDNSTHVNDGYQELMSFMRDNAAWLEFGLHGVRHEHWENGVRTRAEFANTSGQGWGTRNATLHLQCFAELLHQYYSAEENPFPVSFVPPDHAFPNMGSDTRDTSASIATFGVRLAQMPGNAHFESGIFFMNRETSSSPPWNAESKLPGTPRDESSWVMTHLPNFYGAEDAWVEWLSTIDSSVSRILPKNSSFAASQYLYSTFTRLGVRPDGLYLNTLAMPADAYTYDLLEPIAIKVDMAGHTSVALTENSDLKLVASYRDKHNHAILFLSQPGQPRGRLAPDILHAQIAWDGPSSDWIELGASTINVYSIGRTATGETMADITVYGRQSFTMVIPNSNIRAVRTDNPAVEIMTWAWNANESRLSISVSGRNMQGERTRVFATRGEFDDGPDASVP